jgi:hypothetical protein
VAHLRLPQVGGPEVVAGRDLCERRACAEIGDDVYTAAYQVGIESEMYEGIAYALGLTGP